MYGYFVYFHFQDFVCVCDSVVVSCTPKKYTLSVPNASLMRLEVRFMSPLSSPCQLVIISLIKLQFVPPNRDYISTTESQMTG